ncbi:hypothetical protein NKG05_19765 [Oerskovia sp. M15]
MPPPSNGSPCLLPTPLLTVRLATVATLGPVDLARWNDLAEHAVEPNVFYGPDFLIPTAARFDHDRTLHLVVVESGDTWLAVMPYEMVPANRRWPHRHASNDGPILNQFTSFGLPLLRDVDARRAATGLVRAFRRFSHELGGSIEMAFVSGDGAGVRRSSRPSPSRAPRSTSGAGTNGLPSASPRSTRPGRSAISRDHARRLSAVERGASPRQSAPRRSSTP